MRKSAKGLKTHQVHELAEAKIKETDRFRSALGISKNYEEGSHWKKAEERAKEHAERAEREEKIREERRAREDREREERDRRDERDYSSDRTSRSSRSARSDRSY